MANIAYENGITHSECKGKLKRYIDKVYFKNKKGVIRVYGDMVYIFSVDKALITVLHLPNELKGVVRKIEERKKCGANQDQNQ